MKRLVPSPTEIGVALSSAALAFAYARSDGPTAATLLLAIGVLGALQAPDRSGREGLLRAVVACAAGVLAGTLSADLARTSLLILVFAIGRAGRMLRLERAASDARAAAAIVEERARIARDLHDVIAHSMAVVMVQLQAAERVMDADPAKARAALQAAARVGHDALDEMHRMVGVMRGEGPRESQHSLADLPALIEQARSAGMVAELEIDDGASDREVTPGVQLAAYRIVQEALTNAVRHAAGGRVEVRVVRRPAALELEVADSGGRSAHADGGGGFGIAGMRERAAVYGGTVEAGPRGDGFAVTARLPVGRLAG